MPSYTYITCLKVKVKFALEKAMKTKEGVELQLSYFYNATLQTLYPVMLNYYLSPCIWVFHPFRFSNYIRNFVYSHKDAGFVFPCEGRYAVDGSSRQVFKWLIE
jgi:hypothetical protein